MFPVLFSIGPITIKTFFVLLLIGFFISGFIFWRKGREEHYEIMELFDGFLLSALAGIIIARSIHILFNLNHFGLDIFKWFNFISNPGFNLLVGVFAAGLYLYKFSIKKKWDPFEVLDFWVTSVSLGLFLNYLGLFFEGVGYGYQTNMPWGVVFPQLIDPHHPTQLYTALFYLLLYFFIARVEYSYRTFSWYRYGKKTAQTGFLVSMFFIFSAIFNFFVSFLRPSVFEFFGVNFDILLSIALLIVGLFLLYYRSGRPLPFPVKRKPKPARTKLEQIGE
jgi:phosphatidylglycerol:prolipoprotein diacylglycerol transferase